MAELTFVGISAGIMSLIASAAIGFLGSKMLQKWKAKKNKATLYLLLSTIAYLVTCLSGTITYFTAPYNIEVARLTNKIIYSAIFLATMLMFMFATEIFFEPAKHWVFIYLLLGFVIIAVINIMDSVTEQYIGEYPVLILKDLFVLLLVGYLVPTNVGLFLVARRASTRIEDPLYQAGYRAIALGELNPILAFVADAAASLTMEYQFLYTVFLLLTWVFPMIAIYFLYAGYILPDWFKKRVSQTLQKKTV